MKIHVDHFYHGAALTQIVEHPQFTAINAFRDGRKISRSSFIINQDIYVYLKYGINPVGPFKEYQFAFLKKHLREIEEIEKRAKKTFIVLICVKDREICVIAHEELFNLINKRKNAKGSEEETYRLLVVVSKGKSLQVYIDSPGVRGIRLNEIIIPRKSFPGAIFEESSNV